MTIIGVAPRTLDGHSPRPDGYCACRLPLPCREAAMIEAELDDAAGGDRTVRLTAECLTVVRAVVAAIPVDPDIGLPVALTEEFYRSLFERAPAIRSLFPANLSPQSERLCRELLDTVTQLDKTPKEAEQRLLLLGYYHHFRGVRPEHYPYVGHALTDALKEVVIDPPLSSHARSAFIAVYEAMAAPMVRGGEIAAAGLGPPHGASGRHRS